jgi:carboxypeptidase PM20D1
VVLANRWLFGPLLELGFSRMPALDAMLRTTTAVTLIGGGVKENVLPIHAQALVNFRIHPRDSVAAVVEHVRRSVGDPRIRLRVGVGSAPREPSAVSPVDCPAFRLLQRTVAELFPGVPAIPYLVLGGTDARHYGSLTPNVYRFGPWVMGKEALRLAHGTDERISLENLVRGVRFYLRLLESAAAPAQGSSA